MAAAEQQTQQDIPLLEWLVGAIGLVLVLATLGYLAYAGWTNTLSPPKIQTKMQSISPNGDGYLVIFNVVNTGGETAAGVTVEGTLHNGNQEVERSTATIDYVPDHSTRGGGLFFKQNPAQFHFELKAIGYANP